MAVTTVLRRGSISVVDYRCGVGPGDAPFVERHGGFDVAYVRHGSFGYHTRGESFELVAGSILVGRPDDEYMCTHDHVHGDECLFFQLAPELLETIGGGTEVWRTGGVPPLPELMVLGELAQAAAAGRKRRRARRSGNGPRGPRRRGRLRAEAKTAGSRGTRSSPRGGVGALVGRALARATRPRERRVRGWAQRVSLLAAHRERARRDATPVRRPLPATPRGAPARRGHPVDHRRRVRRRVRRPLQLRAHVPSRSRCLPATLPSGREGRSYDLPGSARRFALVG